MLRLELAVPPWVVGLQVLPALRAEELAGLER